MPNGTTGTSAEDVRNAAMDIGFPVLIRPSYVLGGRGMEILSNEQQLEKLIEVGLLNAMKKCLKNKETGVQI